MKRLKYCFSWLPGDACNSWGAHSLVHLAVLGSGPSYTQYSRTEKLKNLKPNHFGGQRQESDVDPDPQYGWPPGSVWRRRKCQKNKMHQKSTENEKQIFLTYIKILNLFKKIKYCKPIIKLNYIFKLTFSEFFLLDNFLPPASGYGWQPMQIHITAACDVESVWDTIFFAFTHW